MHFNKFLGSAAAAAAIDLGTTLRKTTSLAFGGPRLGHPAGAQGATFDSPKCNMLAEA